MSAPRTNPEPTMLRTALKPRWLAALALTIVVSGFFIWLSIWQAEQSVSSEPPPREQTETPIELTEFFTPYEPILESQLDQMVTFTGEVIPEHSVQVGNRIHDGETGYWLVSEATVDGAETPIEGMTGTVNIPIVWGWIENPLDLSGADDDPVELDTMVDHFTQATGLAEENLHVRFTGRLLPADGPIVGTNLSTTPITTRSIASSELINLWDTELHNGYVVVETFETPDGAIHTAEGAAHIAPVSIAPPPEETEVIWLNVFYAIEWVIFALFAAYLWWRFVRDDYLKDRRELELDELWEQYWRTKELEKRREQARRDKEQAIAAYRAYYGRDPEQ